jgi:hypothetical protein
MYYIYRFAATRLECDRALPSLVVCISSYTLSIYRFAATRLECDRALPSLVVCPTTLVQHWCDVR